MASAGIPTRVIDLFHDYRGFGKAEARPTVFLRYQCREPARRGEHAHERLWVKALLVQVAKICGRKSGAQLSYRITQFLVGFKVRRHGSH
jgi:hypothetical protein